MRGLVLDNLGKLYVELSRRGGSRELPTGDKDLRRGAAASSLLLVGDSSLRQSTAAGARLCPNPQRQEIVLKKLVKLAVR